MHTDATCIYFLLLIRYRPVTTAHTHVIFRVVPHIFAIVVHAKLRPWFKSTSGLKLPVSPVDTIVVQATRANKSDLLSYTCVTKSSFKAKWVSCSRVV